MKPGSSLDEDVFISFFRFLLFKVSCQLCFERWSKSVLILKLEHFSEMKSGAFVADEVSEKEDFFRMSDL